MKKLIFSALALCAALLAHGQVLEVSGTQRITLPDGYRVDQANIAPDGSYAVISPLSGKGLTKLDLTTGQTSVLATTGSNYDLKFTADSRNIIYKDVTIGKDNLRRVAVKSTDVQTMKTVTLVKPSRDIQGISVNGATAIAIDGGRLKTKQLSAVASTDERPELSIDRGQLMITKGGRTQTLSPLGTDGKSYIWQSLSPNGKKVLFYVVGDGCYTCDLDGTNVRSLGILRAPVWYDDNTIVGMVNESDGYVITASKLVASTADGKVRQTLTAADVAAIYPSTAKGKIAFSTPDGQLYIITIK